MVRNKPLFEVEPCAFIRVPTLPVETINHGVENLLHDDLFNEAVRVATPQLLSAHQQQDTNDTKKYVQEQSSLLRYMLRMCSRTTPFGLFAGVAQISVGKNTRLRLCAPTAHRHRTRIDMGWLQHYLCALERDPSIKNDLWYTHQPIIVRTGNQYSFEYKDAQGITRWTSIDISPGLEQLLKSVANGAPYAHISSQIQAAVPEATPESTAAFLDSMISYGIIRSSLTPQLTCADPAKVAVSALQQTPSGQPAAHSLRRIIARLRQYDRQQPGNGHAELQAAIADIQHTHATPSSRPPVNIDMRVRFQGTAQLQQSIATDAERLAELLLRLSAYNPDLARLALYRKKFKTKYGRHRLVSAAELLNDHTGLGLPSNNRPSKHPGSTSWAATRNRLLLSLAADAIRDQRTTVTLDENLVRQLTNPFWDNAMLPESLDMAVQIAAHSQAAVNNGEYLMVSSPITGAQLAGRTAGRFADLLGVKTQNYLQSIVDKIRANHPEKLYAELVCMPQHGHDANVAIRPPLRPYEIAVDATPGVSPQNTLSLDDLYIGLKNDYLYVWSATRQKEVAVQAGHMLNIVSAPNICNFLADASCDGVYPLASFSWGAAAQLPMLPRLQYGRLVLSLATWTFDIKGVRHAQDTSTPKSPPSNEEWINHIRQWCRSWNVPRFVYLTETDNRLLLDTGKGDHLHEIIRAAHRTKSGHVQLQEALPGPEDAWVTGLSGRYISECIFQLIRKADMPRSARPPHAHTVRRLERTILPGGEWLHCKLYLAPRLQNRCLAFYVKQLTDALSSTLGLGEWFFIRYADPTPHIRLRCKGDKATINNKVIPLIMSWGKLLHEQGLLSDFIIAPYEREIERYGGRAAIGMAEAVFTADSEAALRFIQMNQDNTLDHLSLFDVAVVSTQILKDAFTLNIEQPRRKSSAQPYKQFAASYRQDRDKLLAVLHDYYAPAGNRASPILQVLTSFYETLLPISARYRQLEREKKLTAPIDDIIRSFVHMHCNRLLGTNQRTEERLLVFAERMHNDYPQWSKRYQ